MRPQSQRNLPGSLPEAERERRITGAWGGGFFLCLLLLTLAAGPSRAKTLWVVLLPGSSLSDWREADAPHLHQILATGSVALMNTRTARTPSDHVRGTPESAALTLGAGSRAAGGPEATDFLPEDTPILGDVTAGGLYTRRTGLAAPAGSRVNVQWPRVLRENAVQGYDLHPGDLTDALRSAGVTVQAVGGPLADAVATTGTGVLAPVFGGDRCVVWDAGTSVHAANAELGTLMAHLGGGRLIVLSPSANDRDFARGARLCPVAVWGRDVPSGLIFSASTRRAGLVTDTDFATTVAAYFGVPLSDFPVRPFGEHAWEYRPVREAVRQVAAINSGALAQWDGMRALPYLALFLGIWMMGVTALAQRRPLPAWTASVPPAVILALLLSTSPMTLMLWLAASLVSALVIRPAGYAIILGALLIGDMITGDPLMRDGLLGYSAIEGARYYGIGNEAMGALVGACLIAADGALRAARPRSRWWVWAALLGVTALLGSPGAGAKAGGLVVALAAFGSYGWLRSGRRLDARTVTLGATAIALLLLGVAFMDAHWNGLHASHFGQAAARLSSGGGGEWADIIRRKLRVEGHLLWHSAWALPLWGGLASLTLVGWTAAESDRPLLLGGLVAVGACLAVNDAGAVAGALCLALLWSHLFVHGWQKARPLHSQGAG